MIINKDKSSFKYNFLQSVYLCAQKQNSKFKQVLKKSYNFHKHACPNPTPLFHARALDRSLA